MNNIIDELVKSNNIVLLCHKNPDGDAIGSVLSLYHVLKRLGKAVDVVIKDVPIRFSFMSGYDLIKDSSDKCYDVCVVVDTASDERVNDPSNIFGNVKKRIVIDHHKSNIGYGDVNYIEVAPACSQIMYKLIEMMKVDIDEEIGTCLCVGLLTDTGCFSHPDVNSYTYMVAASLSKIVDIPSIYKKVMGTITKSQFELKKIVMDNLEFYHNEQIAFSCVTYNDILRVGASRDECDILVNIGREIENVEVSIFIRLYEDEMRVSLRSNNIDVNEILKIFGGGGHKNAAGVTISNINYDELKKKILEVAGKKIDEWYISGK